jgi:cellulose synthase (UDP-forming)
MGFFAKPRVGIVQVPHAFYNYDPTQSSLALQKALPDDQRFFFEAVMPSRDGWDAAFCCGSNSVTRREAPRSVGDALPTESITEDMLLSIALLRNGYITRYLCERLAFGRAPEGLNAEVPAPALPLAAVAKLPAQSLVVPSRPQSKRLGSIAAERKIAA